MNDPEDFPIVGIGASAGGVEALEGRYTDLPIHVASDEKGYVDLGRRFGAGD